MFCFGKLNVFCLCNIVYACHMGFLHLYLPLLFFKNKQITYKEKYQYAIQKQMQGFMLNGAHIT
jgi:hypothetical protein